MIARIPAPSHPVIAAFPDSPLNMALNIVLKISNDKPQGQPYNPKANPNDKPY